MILFIYIVGYVLSYILWRKWIMQYEEYTIKDRWWGIVISLLSFITAVICAGFFVFDYIKERIDWNKEAKW